MKQKEQKSFIFLGDLISYESNKSIVLFDKLTLKKPNNFQLNLIKKFVDNRLKIKTFSINLYEFKKIEPEGYAHQYQKLINKKEWNYWILELPDNKIDYNRLLTLALSSLDLTILFQAIYVGAKITGKNSEYPAISCRELSVANFFHDTSLHNIKIKKIDAKSVQELMLIFDSLSSFEKHKKLFSFIDKALKDYIYLKDVSNQSPFKVLTYFSILENLLTTFRPKGTYEDSVNNQLQKKLNLINNIANDKINFTSFFKGPDTLSFEKIIEILYRYRNSIAHGNIVDFENEFQLLYNKDEKIFDFLNTLLKKVLIMSIKNPQFIKDLKSC